MDSPCLLNTQCISMSDNTKKMLDKIKEGRTDLVFDYVSDGHPANTKDDYGMSLIQWCAHHGDVSAIRFLISKGESLQSLGENLDLHNASFHGHLQLCEYLIAQLADVNLPLPDTGETPLHYAICKTDREKYDPIVRVLLAHGANPNSATKESAPTEAFMRDIRTKAETPLHRAAAFGTEETIQLLLDAGAKIDVKDMHGDSPLTWASWHLRPPSILRKLCYGNFRIHPSA